MDSKIEAVSFKLLIE